MELDFRGPLEPLLLLLPLAKAPILGRRLGALCSWKELVLLLFVNGRPPPTPDPLSLLLRFPDELAFWNRCLLADPVAEADVDAEAFLEAGPLLTPGLRPVCCFLLEDPEEIFDPLALLVFGTPLEEVLEPALELELELEPELLPLPVLLMVSLRPSWLLGFTMYSVEAPVPPPAGVPPSPLVAKQLLGGAVPGCCGCCSIAVAPAAVVAVGVDTPAAAAAATTAAVVVAVAGGIVIAGGATCPAPAPAPEPEPASDTG